jgi:2-hydroxychromene-2-carboxylate isomerase
MAEIDFWYEFASTYSYPAAMRIERLAAGRGVKLRWRPFLLGPIFAEIGWRDSPFNIFPLKGRYMWRDLARICGALGLPLQRPQPFPQNSLLAARTALALEGEARASFSRSLYLAEFGDGRTISDRAVISAVLQSIGADPEATLARAESLENKGRLKAECALAKTLKLPGAPCLVTTDGEVFWGNDRIEQALDWEAGRRESEPPHSREASGKLAPPQS